MIQEGGGKLRGKVEKGILKVAKGGKKGLERLTNRHSEEDLEPSEWTVGVAKHRVDPEERTKDIRFTSSTKPDTMPSENTLGTSSTRGTTQMKHVAAADPTPARDDSATGVVIFHESIYKIQVVYWRQELFSLPENGQLSLEDGKTAAFKGIAGTKLAFDLNSIDVVKSSRMGGLMHDAFTITPKETAGTVVKGKPYVFTCFLEENRSTAVKKIRSAIADARLVEEEKKFDGSRVKTKEMEQEQSPFVMEADPRLQQMQIIATKKIRGVSLQDYYEVAWSEGVDCDKSPMYQPFLESMDKNNVVVSPWETAGGYKGEWCGGTYASQRTVTFQFMKQTIGMTLVNVKHTQRCQRVNDDRCIVQMTLEMKGFPYADCFVVHVRHVATRVGECDLKIEIGMHVQFLKSCLFEKKIRTNTGAETAKAQQTLLNRTVEGCKGYAKVSSTTADSLDDEDEDQVETKEMTESQNQASQKGSLKLPEVIVTMLRTILMTLAVAFRTYLVPYIPEQLIERVPPRTVEEAVANSIQAVDSLRVKSLESVSERRKNDVLREIGLIEKSIERIERIHAAGLN